MSNKSNNDPWRTLIHKCLAARDNDRATIARIRRGIDKVSEHRAFGDVCPYAQGPREEQALLRAAALVALHPTISQIASEDRRDPPGGSFRRMSIALARQRGSDNPEIADPARLDSIAVRLEQLPDLDLDSAAHAINRILALGDDLKVPIDYYALTRMLIHWGDGLSDASQAVRSQPLRDYYRYRPNADKPSAQEKEQS